MTVMLEPQQLLLSLRETTNLTYYRSQLSNYNSQEHASCLSKHTGSGLIERRDHKDVYSIL